MSVIRSVARRQRGHGAASCAQCEEPLPAFAVQCRYCGTPAADASAREPPRPAAPDQPTRQPPPARPAGDRRWRTWALVSLLLLVAVGLVAGLGVLLIIGPPAVA